jgi:aerobic-type carbon monoxide dehydrogenase small subunit (CoxS/CutS family)
MFSDQMTRIVLRVNGTSRDIEADPSTPMIFILRNQFGLTGAKYGCGLEQCGACAVLVDGDSALTCVRPVSEFAGCEIVTVEGLAEDERCREVQQVFIEESAAQCGYCTPGIVVATTALLNRTRRPSEADIHEALHGHLCRCGAHAGVLKAIRRLVRKGAASGA